jgi:hypothetical protein
VDIGSLDSYTSFCASDIYEFNFMFPHCILTTSHFYWLTDALNWNGRRR